MPVVDVAPMIESRTESPRGFSKRPTRGVEFAVVVVLATAFLFQGSRGLWAPDEGRYVGGALSMIDSGRYAVPSVHGEMYLDKPPLVYWASAAGIRALGRNEWGARMAHGIGFALTAALLGFWVARLRGREAGALAAGIYATSPMAFAAANVVTPDSLLALWTTAAALCYWLYLQSVERGERWRWALLWGAAIGLGILTKGPAMLVFVVPSVAHLLWVRRSRALLSPELWVAAPLAVGIGGSWYLWTVASIPGAASYIFDNQIAGRLWGDQYHRNPEWWKPITVYGLGLILGFLPWCLPWARPQVWRDLAAARRGAAAESIGVWLGFGLTLPLLLLTVASSRLTLYALPLVSLLVVATVLTFRPERRPTTWWRRIVVVAVILLVVKLGAAWAPARRDTRALADDLRRHGARSTDCVAVVETKFHGLGLYGFSNVSWFSLWRNDYPFFAEERLLPEHIGALSKSCEAGYWIVARPMHSGPVGEFLRVYEETCSSPDPDDGNAIFHCESRAL